eukprot:superscaffoldBa00003055_g15990
MVDVSLMSMVQEERHGHTGLALTLAHFTLTLPIKTFEGLLTNPGYNQAEDKALYLLSSLAVTEQEKQQIERAPVGQAKNALW